LVSWFWPLPFPSDVAPSGGFTRRRQAGNRRGATSKKTVAAPSQKKSRVTGILENSHIFGVGRGGMFNRYFHALAK
jgi:hypothetical protein